jgi:hypothetical protein
MPVKVLIICMILCIFAFTGPLTSTAFSGEDHEKIAKYYESCIVREIAKCESKLVLLRMSKSKNLKDYAEMKAQKAEYLNAEKEVLIEEMLEMQLEPKQYKVELYLQSRFNEWDQ